MGQLTPMVKSRPIFLFPIARIGTEILSIKRVPFFPVF